jgi:hypothetical protein
MYQRTTPLLRRASPSRARLIRNLPAYGWRPSGKVRMVMLPAPARAGFEYPPTLGFSLNPISWIKSGVNAAKALFKGSSVQIPGVPGSVPVKDLPTILRGSSIQFGTPPQGPMQQVGAAVESIPGGWGTLAAIGGAVVLGMAMSRRR